MRHASSVTAALARYRAPLPKLRASEQQRHEPTVYFCTPDYDVAAGGIRVAYRHVDILNDAGISAAVLHRRRGFRCTWFDNRTRVVASGATTIGPEDLVVVGELATHLLGDLPQSHRFVVFNQNAHLTWRNASDVAVRGCAFDPRLVAILTVSTHSAEMLRYAFPGADVQRLHNSIDPRVFSCSAGRRARTIAYMPRRGREDALQALGMLNGRGALEGWTVEALSQLSEREVADRLRTSMIFMSLAYQEGFGLPAAEAMACGNYVVGFDGFSGREFFDPDFTSPVPAGDVVALARAVERVIRLEEAEPGWCASRGQAAARFIADEYSMQRERGEVVAVYGSFTSGGSGTPSRREPSASDAGAVVIPDVA